MKLTKEGENYLRDQLTRYGDQEVIDALDNPKCWSHWVEQAIWARLEKSPDEDVSFELGSFYTKDKNPHTIDLYDKHFYCGELLRASDHSVIRDATYEERHESDTIKADEINELGSFEMEIDGEKTIVYVRA